VVSCGRCARRGISPPRAVDAVFRTERPELVFVAAVRVGGVAANDRDPADFIRDNLGIALM
jgi:GDP-L-fucose synthase